MSRHSTSPTRVLLASFIVAGVVIVVAAGTLLARRKGVAVEPATNRPES